MRIVRCALAGLVLVLAACEPADTGGGGGVGGKLAFIRDGALVVSLDSGDQERDLTDPNTSADPALSPTGQTVAFAFAVGGDLTVTSLQTVPFAGDVRTPVATPNSGQSFSQPAWSKDGSTIVFVDTEGADTQLMTVPATGGSAPTPVAPTLTDLHFPAYLDDHTLLVSKGASLELETLDLTTLALTDLGISSPSRGAVSTDGSKIAYSRVDATTQVVVRDLATGAETPVASTGFGDFNPTFAPDDTFVAFDAKGPSDSSPKIYAAKTDGTGGTLLLQSGHQASWSP